MSQASLELPNIDLHNLPGVALIAETLRRLREERGQLESFVESSFAAMEALGTRLSQRQSEIALRKARLEEREQVLQERSSQNDDIKQLMQQQLEQLTAELNSVRSDITLARASAGDDPNSGQLQAVVAKLEEQRDDLKQRLDVCRDELARRADATEQLASTQTQLSESRKTILELQEQIDQLDKEVSNSDSDHERVALETELEMVRRRAAELSEALAEQKDQLTHQQALWSVELKNLRQIIDTQAGGWSRQTVERTAASEQTVASPAPQRESPPPPAEPVVDSIMEQFAKLQKDVAQRRKRKLQ